MGIVQTYTDDVAGWTKMTNDRIVSINTNITANLVGVYNNVFKMVWQNPKGLTPQQVFDSFGTSAVQLFQAASLMGQLIGVADPTSAAALPTPAGINQTYTINQDGTVTVTTGS